MASRELHLGVSNFPVTSALPSAPEAKAAARSSRHVSMASPTETTPTASYPLMKQSVTQSTLVSEYNLRGGRGGGEEPAGGRSTLKAASDGNGAPEGNGDGGGVGGVGVPHLFLHRQESRRELEELRKRKWKDMQEGWMRMSGRNGGER